MKNALPLCLLGLLGSVALAMNQNAPTLPDPLKTPGDVLTSDASMICRPGYTKTVRNVPQQVKEAVYQEYGIQGRENGEYEVDHLISLELGGSNSVRNLWPESFKTQPLNAHVKDDIENKLHELACAGRITFPEAQQAIAHNWEDAYVHYLGPLPGGARARKHQKQPSVPVTHVPTLPGGAATPPEPQADPLHPALTVPILPELNPSESASTQPATPTESEAVTPTPDGGCPQTAPVKVSRAGIYHLPDDPNYAQTHPVACFDTAQSAQAAGYRAPK